MFAEYAIQVDRARGVFEASVGCEYVDYICDSRIVCIVYPDKKLHGIVCVAKQWLQFVCRTLKMSKRSKVKIRSHTPPVSLLARIYKD